MIGIYSRIIGLVLLQLLLIKNYSVAQHGELGTWNILSLRYTFNTKWSVFGEGQIRSLSYYHQFHYYEVKGGAEYKITPQVRVALAGGKYDTYKEGGNFVLPKTSDEFRLWPQFIIVHPMNRITLEHRYRAELRCTTAGYRNRFRYRLGVYYDLRKKEPKSLKAYVTNELFFTNRATYFERNRFSAGVQYTIKPMINVLLAYMYQFDYNLVDETGRDFFQIGCTFDFKSKSQKTTNSAE
jgi:long-subunit fatty acid transport protein